jgi:hypothetical protein
MNCLKLIRLLNRNTDAKLMVPRDKAPFLVAVSLHKGAPGLFIRFVRLSGLIVTIIRSPRNNMWVLKPVGIAIGSSIDETSEGHRPVNRIWTRNVLEPTRESVSCPVGQQHVLVSGAARTLHCLINYKNLHSVRTHLHYNVLFHSFPNMPAVIRIPA